MHNYHVVKGMCGPLIVTEPGEKFNSATDKIFFIIEGGWDAGQDLIFLNGKRNTDTMSLKQGIRYRFRIINITGLGSDLNVSLLYDKTSLNWRMIAKDGGDLPTQQRLVISANAQPVTIGETRDFEFQPQKTENYFFFVKLDVAREI